jgi:hypothetical protein
LARRQTFTISGHVRRILEGARIFLAPDLHALADGAMQQGAQLLAGELLLDAIHAGARELVLTVESPTESSVRISVADDSGRLGASRLDVASTVRRLFPEVPPVHIVATDLGRTVWFELDTRTDRGGAQP